jgi:hypothetical protein
MPSRHILHSPPEVSAVSEASFKYEGLYSFKEDSGMQFL